MPQEPEPRIDPAGYWRDKTPCWEIRECADEARLRCRAYLNQRLPCWKQVTLCKEILGIETCRYCQVYRLYGAEQEEETPL